MNAPRATALIIALHLCGVAAIRLRLNARNLTNKHYLNGTFQYGDPFTLIGTIGLRF